MDTLKFAKIQARLSSLVKGRDQKADFGWIQANSDHTFRSQFYENVEARYYPLNVISDTTDLPTHILDQLRFLPDDEIVLQICRAVRADRRDDAVRFRAFLVARCSLIEDGVDFTTAACLSATRFDDFTVECLHGLACDETITEFAFSACQMASDDLVGEWRERFEKLGLLEQAM